MSPLSWSAQCCILVCSVLSHYCPGPPGAGCNAQPALLIIGQVYQSLNTSTVAFICRQSA